MTPDPPSADHALSPAAPLDAVAVRGRNPRRPGRARAPDPGPPGHAGRPPARRRLVRQGVGPRAGPRQRARRRPPAGAPGGRRARPGPSRVVAGDATLPAHGDVAHAGGHPLPRAGGGHGGRRAPDRHDRGPVGPPGGVRLAGRPRAARSPRGLARRPARRPGRRRARARQLRLTKPPGSLGRLEDIGAQLAGITGEAPPPLPGRRPPRSSPATTACTPRACRRGRRR